ncbi:MAG: alkaline phosphatase family protein [Verrucomicrobiales bacterium]
MFRSLASSLITLFIVVLAGLLLIFITVGSADLDFKRVAMADDRATRDVLGEYVAAARAESGAVDVPEDPGAMPADDEPEVIEGDGLKVVLWISIPGFRGDYLGNSETPFFDRMLAEGAGTTKLRPNFPCLDFPAHASLATGTLVSKHGIPLDKFRTESGEVADHPTDQALLRAEPIWATATRQGVRTLVHDWPLSQNQSGGNAAAISLSSYDPGLTDKQRLDLLWEAWSNDPGETVVAPPKSEEEGEEKGEEKPDAAAEAAEAVAGDGEEEKPEEKGEVKKLRLLMVKLSGVLEAGMKNGPREAGAYQAVGELDTVLGEFFKKVEENWAKLAPEEGSLAVVITTDHGLVDLDKYINVPQLLGEDLMKNLDVVAHDAVGHLFFKDLPASAGAAKILTDNLDGELRKRIYFRTLTREDLPAEWSYNAEGRIGDRVLVLKNGYAFTDVTASKPIFDSGEGPAMAGGFGYPVETSVRMSGQAIIWGFPESPASGDLGEIDFQKFHATVSKLLGIQPADGAVADTLPVD